jgi:tetratricopeptide (TPR) repeat protein
MSSPGAYLLIPGKYADALRGLRWAAGHDAVETEDGRTFALAEEVASFLEGFASRRPLIHFAHVLHLLSLLRVGRTAGHDFDHLALAWREAGRPARTAGAFLAGVCGDVPSLTPPRMEDIRLVLQLRSPYYVDTEEVQDPPLTPGEFEAVVALALEQYDQAQLVHGLRHGQLPTGDGARLAREVLRARPPSLGEVLAEAARHERLAGAVPLVDRLVGALALPPRRLAEPQLPLGGYADVGTRGQPEQVLPVQLALDELEFLRRHAEHELLYYRREEPHTPTRDELVVLLDQGVRTWGRVRLALAGCALALGEMARRRALALRFATTGNGGHLIDPLAVAPAELAEALAGSDLTAHPGLALEQVVEERARRDVVLLTAPRNLDEPDLQAAARRVGPQTRLFAVAVAASGEAALCELRRGLPVPLGRFRLDLDVPGPARLAGPAGEWRGEVEPVGYPFRFGPGGNHEPLLFAFDQAGEWLLAALQHGLLLLMRRDGSAHEMLPRALVEGRLLSDVHGVLGVTGGFVVTGGVPGQVVAVHYDLASRQVNVHAFAAGASQLTRGLEWRYLRRRHALLVRLGDEFSWVHLATGQRDQPFPAELRWGPSAPPTRLSVPLPPRKGGEGSAWRRPVLHSDPRTGTLGADDLPGWQPFTPLADGRPALVGRTLMRADCQRDVLAVLFLNPARGKELWLFQEPDGRTLTTLLLPFDRDAFCLSPDGSYLAVQRGPCQVEVRETAPGGSLVGGSPVGRFHNNLVVHLGEQWLSLAIDRRVHLLEWASGTLMHHHSQVQMSDTIIGLSSLAERSDRPTQALPGRVPGFLGYDRGRLTARVPLRAYRTAGVRLLRLPLAGRRLDAGRHLLGGRGPAGPCAEPRRRRADRAGAARCLAARRGDRHMKVPFHLRRTTRHPAVALLLLDESVPELLALCAGLGGPELPAVHAVAGGFLVRLGRESDEAYPRTIRLRCLAPNLLLPADAELAPALLSDEAEALVRQRGLVFLPSGRVLAFAPDVVLGAAELLDIPHLPRRAWRPLPPRPERPERIEEVVLEAPPGAIDELLAAGGSGIGVEPPRPAEAGSGAVLAGHTLAGLGRSLAWLGQHLGLEGLARLGARLVEQAIRQAPRVSEALLGRQEAALRELLRQFREGDVEQALRHALPLGGPQERGSRAAEDARLPTHDLVYSLGALLGGGQGPGSVWLAAGDVYDELASEYRRAAELATRRGDHRRAAFIHGKLLHDWRQAAAVLERGGLHHDAAVLYLEKLGDAAAAARAFESAGEVDRALELYLARGDHVAAGDLLGRAGEPERALAQYERGAAQEAARGNHLAAGELLLRRAGRPDRAEPYFQAGWRQRPWGSFQGCLLHLLGLYARRPGPAELLALVDEADDFFRRDGSDQQAAQFYNELAREAQGLAGVRERLHDRALLGLAGRLRQRSALGQHGPALTAALFQPSGPWEPGLVRDAEVALRGAARDRPAGSGACRRLRAHAGRVTAVCAARLPGQMFLGFEDGTVVRFDPRQGSSRYDFTGRIDAVSTDDEGRLLVVVSHEMNSDRYLLQTYRFVDQRRTRAWVAAEEVLAPPRLTPVAGTRCFSLVGLWDGQALRFLTGTDLVPEARVPGPAELRMALLLPGQSGERLRLCALLFEPDGVALVVVGREGLTHTRLGLPWCLGEPAGAEALPLSWLPPRGRYLEVAGLTHTGAVGWAVLRLFGDDAAVLSSQQTASEPPFRAVALLRPGLVAGVQARGVQRFFVDEQRLQPRPLLRADLANAVACCYSPATGELLVATEEGDVVRVPLAE